MTLLTPHSPLRSTPAAELLVADPAAVLPGWVGNLFEESQPVEVASAQGVSISIRRANGAAITTCRLPMATRLDAAVLRGGVAGIYRAVCEVVAGSATPHPVRIWNMIPGIHDRLAPGLDRYRVFNQGRHDALVEWPGGSEAFGRTLPTATGIGHRGDHLIVHCLSAAEPGLPVDNPRQTPAYCYSTRHGPRPPCFARGTIARLPAGAVGDGPALLIGGTASVCGEDSVHVGDLAGQIEETFENLASLIAAAGVDPRGSGGRTANPLGRMVEARGYVKRGGDMEIVRRALADRFGSARTVEVVQAEICREDLLFEVEGVASLA